jgi:hypothetical protein
MVSRNRSGKVSSVLKALKIMTIHHARSIGHYPKRTSAAAHVVRCVLIRHGAAHSVRNKMPSPILDRVQNPFNDIQIVSAIILVTQ